MIKWDFSPLPLPILHEAGARGREFAESVMFVYRLGPFFIYIYITVIISPSGARSKKVLLLWIPVGISALCRRNRRRERVFVLSSVCRMDWACGALRKARMRCNM